MGELAGSRGSIPQRVNAAGFYTLPQAAQILGRHVDTVQRWIRQGLVDPPRTMTFGELDVPVFSPADIEDLRLAGLQVKRGRPRTVGLTPAMRDPQSHRLVSINTFLRRKQHDQAG